MTSSKAKICKECGCLDWKQQYSASTYGLEENMASENGDYEENFDDDSDPNDWEECGDPTCVACDGYEIMDIDDLTSEQFKIIYNLDPVFRVAAIELMRAGKEVDPETGEEIQKEKDDKKIGGYKIKQV